MKFLGFNTSSSIRLETFLLRLSRDVESSSNWRNLIRVNLSFFIKSSIIGTFLELASLESREMVSATRKTARGLVVSILGTFRVLINVDSSRIFPLVSRELPERFIVSWAIPISRLLLAGRIDVSGEKVELA